MSDFTENSDFLGPLADQLSQLDRYRQFSGGTYGRGDVTNTFTKGGPWLNLADTAPFHDYPQSDIWIDAVNRAGLSAPKKIPTEAADHIVLQLANFLNRGYERAAKFLPETANDVRLQAMWTPKRALTMSKQGWAAQRGIGSLGTYPDEIHQLGLSPSGSVIKVAPEMLTHMNVTGDEALQLGDVTTRHDLAAIPRGMSEAWMQRALRHDPDLAYQLIGEHFPDLAGNLGHTAEHADINSWIHRGLSVSEARQQIQDDLIYGRPIGLEGLSRYGPVGGAAQQRVANELGTAATENAYNQLAAQGTKDIVSPAGRGPFLDLVRSFADSGGMEGATNLGTVAPLAAGLGGLFLANQLSGGKLVNGAKNLLGIGD